MAGQVELLPRERVKVLSLGGGLDSFAMLVDAIQRGEKPAVVIFADVSDPKHEDPGEWPGTIRHLEEVVAPTCKREGIEFVWLRTDEYPIRGERSLFRYFESKNAMPSKITRLCSAASKVERIRDWLWDRYGSKGMGVEVWIGFDAAEVERAKRDPHALEGGASGWRVNRFPLMETFPSRAPLCRCRSEALVRDAGLPVPRKSACTFCAHASRRDFKTLLDELPEEFAKAEKLEANCKLTRTGKVLRYGYEKGDGTDPTLREWVSKTFGRLRAIPCPVCGAKVRATKATGCGWLTGWVAEAA